MGRLSGLLQFILGFLLGVSLLAGGTAALGFVFFTRMAAPPPKPLFGAEKPEKEQNTAKQPTAKASPAKTETKQQAPKEKPSPKPSPEETKEDLPPGAYKATVTWPEGLSIRDKAGPDATRIGGIMYNDEIIVLETTADGGWQRIRIVGGTQEGWIKAGNIQKVQ